MYRYPAHILPSHLHKHLRSTDIPDHACFARKISSCALPLTIQDIYDNKQAYTQAKEFWEGVSVSLISVYKTRDVRFKIKKDCDRDYHALWDNGDVDLPKSQDVIYDKEATYVGMSADKIKSAAFNVRATESFMNSEKLSKFAELIPSITLKFEHAPTLCNYWHFNIFMYTGEKDTERLDLSNHLGIEKNQVEKIARIVTASDSYAALFVLPNKIHRCNLRKKAYLKANTKHNNI